MLKLLRLLLLALHCALLASGVVDSASNQPEALAAIEAAAAAADTPVSEADVLLALEHGWVEAAKQLLRLLRTRGDAVAAMADVRAKATQIRDEATEVINLMRTGANAEATAVSCAFQWAQRPEYIYLNVKFSSRIDGPVTVLNVDNERVTLGNDTLIFEAVGRQKPKTFKLNLTFHGAIDAERSSWSFASVGRMSFTIAKAVNQTWPRLLAGKAKPKNMHAWYERQTALDAEVKSEKEARANREEANEAKEDEPKAPASMPPTPPQRPVEGNTGGDPVPPKPKKKKKKAKKEEL